MENHMEIKKEELTQDVLKSLLNYDPETGEFTWLINKGRAKAGSIARYSDSYGYLRIKINKKDYFAHRLAWLYVYGEFPENDIDHIDGDRSNNSISNLRKATRSENLQNLALSISNNSGFIGVHFKKSAKKYVARIRVEGRHKHLGYYDTAELASEAYKEAKRKFHRFNPEIPLRNKK